MINKSVITIAVVALLASLGFYYFRSKNNTNSSQNGFGSYSPTASPTQPVSTTPKPEDDKMVSVDEGQNELILEDLKAGTGAEAVAGKTATVNYKGTLVSGVQFDSSYDRGEPFSFILGSGQVIEGWDKGVLGMKVGGKRKLTIPPSLGYGERAIGPIPANSTLIFEVELLEVK